MKFLPTLHTDTISSWIKNSPPYCIILGNCATFKPFTIGQLRQPGLQRRISWGHMRRSGWTQDGRDAKGGIEWWNSRARANFLNHAP